MKLKAKRESNKNANTPIKRCKSLSHSSGVAGSGQIFFSLEDSRIKQLKVIKGLFGDERSKPLPFLPTPSGLMARHSMHLEFSLHAFEFHPPTTTRKFQAWASREEAGSGKLQNFQNEKEAPALNRPKGPFSTVRLENSPASSLDLRRRKILPPPPAPPPAPRT